MNDNLSHARAAAHEFLARKVYEGVMNPATSDAMAARGFASTTSTLADLRKSGMSEADITTAYLDRLAEARRTNDARGVIAAEYTLAVWSGMQDDLADWLSTAG